MLHIHKDQSSIPRIQVVVYVCNVSDGEAETGIPGACWPASLAYVVSSRPLRGHVSKEMGGVCEDET